MSVIAHSSIYKKSLAGGGGCLRHEQIVDLIESAGLELDHALASPTGGVKHLWCEAMLGCATLCVRHPVLFWRLCGLQRNRRWASMVFQTGIRYLYWRKALKELAASALVCEDMFWGGQGVLLAAREARCPLIALPHNVDSLPFIDTPEGDRITSLRAELESLRRADAVFAISGCDSWLHRQFGIESGVLPYYPAAQRRRQLIQVRAQRERLPRQTRRVLLVGSVTNPPTREGLLRLLVQIAQTPWPKDLVFEVVGRGTDGLQTAGLPSCLRFHGHAAENDFAKLLAECTAALVVQHRGTGVLTRIIEFLVAGIPVVANPLALRQWEGLEGTFCYFDWQQARALLLSSFSMPQLPAPPESEAAAFIHSLRTLSTRNLPACKLEVAGVSRGDCTAVPAVANTHRP
ncbi:MAG TPA: glycosyltransferase [Verrucomicrobiae bacterium]